MTTVGLDFTSTLSRYLPPWLTARLATGQVRAFKYIATAALLADGLMQNAYEGLQAGFPGLGTPEALPLLGRERCIRRGIHETDASYAARLVAWLDTWRGAGNPFAIMHAMRDLCTPSVPKMRIVNDSGTWYTLNPDDSVEIRQTWGAINWNWDGNYPVLSTRFWPIIYSDAGPWIEGPAWGSIGAPHWGDPETTWGSSATPEEVTLLRAVVNDFKCAGDRCEKIIVAFDPTSFDPTAAPGSPGMPDGTWGHWSKNVGGVQVPARLSTARYFDGV